MKKLLLLSFLIPTTVFSSVGLGEYRFGPETSENLACEIAEERAKQDAIAQFIGEEIESTLMQTCINEDCSFQREVFSHLKGVITKIVKYEKEIVEEGRNRNCIVLIEANVQKIENKITLNVETKQKFKDGESVNFSFVTNEIGNLHVFNFYDNFYHKIDSVIIDKQNKEYKLPKENQKLVAFLPKNVIQSKELLVFFFTQDKIDVKNKYTVNEFKNMLLSVKPTKKQLVYRNITIER
jgi:hypothetical protein